MLKLIIPAIVLFLIVLFWEKINKVISNKFNIKVNYIVMAVFFLILVAILTLLYF